MTQRLTVKPPLRAVQPSPGAARLSALSTAAVVEAIVVVLLSARADLYILLQCGEDSEYGRKTYGGYIAVFRTLLVEDGESSPPASGNFQSTSA
jgi:hypothetical protein